MTVTITGSSGIETAQTGDSDITLDAGTGSEAGTQASTINMKLNGTLKGDISVDEARSGNPLELNTTSTGDVVLAMGGGNVGIGAAAPGEKLTVVGDMSVTGGNVGIGIASPTFTAAYGGVHVHSTYPEIHLTGTDSGSTAGDGFKIQKNSANNVYLWNYENAILALGTNNAEAARIDSSGDVRIGTGNGSNTVGPKLYGGGTAGVNNSIELRPEADGSSAYKILTSVNNTASRAHLAFFNTNGVVGSIQTSGSSTSFNTSSDYRLKENIADLTGAIDRVKQVPVRRFNFIADPDKTVDGFLAHEVADVVPEAITGIKDGMKTEEYEVTPAVLDDDGNVVTEAVMGTREVPDYQGIDQSKLVPLLTAALKEAIAEIEALKVRVTALET